jgi:FkbM family methyltransferase
MKKNLVVSFLFIYKKIRRSNLLRNLIKRIIGDDKIEIKFNNFKVRAGIKTALELNVIFDSYNEVTILELISTFTSAGYNFIDVGANIGLHSMTAANSNSNIEIYSFEPEPNNYQQLIENIVLNQYFNIRPFKMGLGDFSENKILNVNEGWNKGKHSLKNKFEGNKKVNIPISTLDSFKENISCENLIIKIDVEGYEKEVVQGAQLIFHQTKNLVLIIELLEENNGLLICKEIVSNLMANNFEYIFKIEDSNGLSKVVGFNGSADYVFIKGMEAKKRIENYTKVAI